MSESALPAPRSCVPQSRRNLVRAKPLAACPIDGNAPASGCGAPGRSVTFRVNGQPFWPEVTWDNNNVQPIDLVFARRVYLPVILK